jgi:hypothetical protein
MKFKNTTNQDLNIPDVGIVKAGEIREMPDGFHNANFVEVIMPAQQKPKVEKIIND